ncbi:MAG: hypothetical protein HGA87_04875 [Desulfobulbaceae bacterium]|nr:hypothetical protein [Desulfobulbaceae bacterium]
MDEKNTSEQKTAKGTEKKQHPRILKVIFTIIFSVLIIHGCESGKSNDTTRKQTTDDTAVAGDSVSRQVGITVTVKSYNGKPIPNKFINVNTLDGTLVVKGVTNTRGVFESIALLPVYVQKLVINVDDNGRDTCVEVSILDNMVNYDFTGVRSGDAPGAVISNNNIIDWIANKNDDYESCPMVPESRYGDHQLDVHRRDLWNANNSDGFRYALNVIRTWMLKQ